MSLRSLYKSCSFGMKSSDNFMYIAHGDIEMLDTDPQWFGHVHGCVICKKILKDTRESFERLRASFSHSEVEAILVRLDDTIRAICKKEELKEIFGTDNWDEICPPRDIEFEEIPRTDDEARQELFIKLARFASKISDVPSDQKQKLFTVAKYCPSFDTVKKFVISFLIGETQELPPNIKSHLASGCSVCDAYYLKLIGRFSDLVRRLQTPNSTCLQRSEEKDFSNNNEKSGPELIFSQTPRKPKLVYTKGISEKAEDSSLEEYQTVFNIIEYSSEIYCSEEYSHRAGSCSDNIPHSFYVLRLSVINPLGVLIIRDKSLWLCAVLDTPLNSTLLEIKTEEKIYPFVSIDDKKQYDIHCHYLKLAIEALNIKTQNKYNVFIGYAKGMVYQPNRFMKYELLLNQIVQANMELRPVFSKAKYPIFETLQAAAIKHLKVFIRNFPHEKPKDKNEMLTLLYYLLYYWDQLGTDADKKNFFQDKYWLPAYFREVRG